MTTLSDLDMMPFGKYSRKPDGPLPMQDVPARYFFWLWTEGGKAKEVRSCPVAEYINRNMGALKQEYPDGIWD